MEIIEPNRFGKLDFSVLENFERANELKLPNDYRNFLIEFNGGRPQPDTVRLQYSSTDVQYFYGIHNGPGWASLFYKLSVYSERIPSWYIPIGNDSFGNLFIMSLNDSNFGEIAFWRHEEELMDGDAADYFENVESLATSFTQFANNLFSG